MSRPPAPILLVARAHWLMGATIFAAIGILHLITRGLPIAFSPKAYLFATTLAALFLLAGTLVWFGRAPGAALSRACSLLYLIRPPLYFALLAASKTPEFRAHFQHPRP